MLFCLTELRVSLAREAPGGGGGSGGGEAAATPRGLLASLCTEPGLPALWAAAPWEVHDYLPPPPPPPPPPRPDPPQSPN